MLVFNEGVPRAGKSYDAVKNHILPTLKKGRRVYARLNGLRHDKIAKHLRMSESDVRALLIVVDTKDVVRTFSCTQDDTGKWCIPDEFKDVLVVIDEVHEFYVNERKPLEPAVENFWALLGQNGGDAVIMTQWINRLHSAVKARIERKNTFQKLTALGAKSRYRVTFFHTTSPGKFEKVGGQTLKYDPTIFPLYDGYAPGAENTDVYEEGGKNVWAAMAVRATIFGVIGLVGLYFFVSYFHKPKAAEPAKPATQVIDATASAVGKVFKPGEAVTAPGQLQGVSAVPVPAPDPLGDLTPEQRYVADLASKGRIRLAALAKVGERYRAWVQWIDTSNLVIEQLEMSQLQAFGFEVTVQPYGVRIASGEHVMVATNWPWTAPVRDAEARLYNVGDSGRAGGVVSAANDADGATAGRAGTSIGKVDRVQGTFPESPSYETKTSVPSTGLKM